MQRLLRVLIRWLGNAGAIVFTLYFIHLAKRSFGPRPKILSRQYRKSAPSDFPQERAADTLSKLASDVAVTAEARIYRSLTGVGSEEPTTTVARLRLASQNMPQVTAFMDYQVNEANGKLVWESKLTWAQYYQRSLHVAETLLASNASFPRHGVALFVSESRPEFFTAWMGVQMLGGVCAAAHAWSSWEEIQVVIRTVNPLVCFTDRPDLHAAMTAAATQVTVFLLDSKEWLLPNDSTTRVSEELEARMRGIRPGHASQILFSSGQQTLSSKPYLLSHDNVTFSARAFLRHHENTSRWGERHPFDKSAPTATTGGGSGGAVFPEQICSFLPLSHVGSLVVDLHAPMCLTAQYKNTACTVWTLHKRGSGGLSDLLFTALAEIRPTIFLAMPRVWERIRRRLVQIDNGESAVTRLALGLGAKWFNAVQAGSHGTEPVGLYYAERLVLNSIKRKLGLDRCKLLMSSGAPIAPKQLEYFGSLGLHVMESFGATGCSGPQCMGRQDYFVCGTVGMSLPSYELKLVPISGDSSGDGGAGEICVRGRHVCMGVLNDAEQTSRVIDDEGFFHTNHVGRLDQFGCLQLIGRRDELVGTASNKLGLNHIEAILRDRARPLADRVVVVVIHSQPETTAEEDGVGPKLRVFITLRQPESGTATALPQGEELWRKLQAAVKEANLALKGVCTIEHFYVLPAHVKFTSFGPDAELTHAGQARRSVIKNKYQNELRILSGPNFSSLSQQ